MQLLMSYPQQQKFLKSMQFNLCVAINYWIYLQFTIKKINYASLLNDSDTFKFNFLTDILT